MTLYSGPSSTIASGNNIVAEEVRGSFERLASSVNNIDGKNFGDLSDQLTYNSIHKGALTQSFQESQLIYGEPATWVAVGRAGSSPVASYSLGVYENEYSVDGCGTRVLLTRPATLKVDAFLQIDEVKLTSAIGSTKVDSVDLRLTLELGTNTQDTLTYAYGSSRPLQETVKDIRVRSEGTDSTFDQSKNLRRGFSLSLTDRLAFSGVPPNGAFVDVWLKMSVEILAANVAEDGNALLADVAANPLLYAHLKSRSRGITIRVFQNDVSSD